VLHDELCRAGIDHVHVHFANKAARLASLVRRMAGPSYSVTTHANDIWHRKVRAEDLRAILGDASFVATVSEENRRHLAETLGRPRDVHVVSSSADLSRLGQPRRKQPESGPVLAVTRFVPKKGLNDLIEACAILAQRSLRVRLELVGDGPLRPELAFDLRPVVSEGPEREADLVRRAGVEPVDLALGQRAARPCLAGQPQMRQRARAHLAADPLDPDLDLERVGAGRGGRRLGEGSQNEERRDEHPRTDREGEVRKPAIHSRPR
jgi:glycosyltransferase involved in cell wall biosynthesis